MSEKILIIDDEPAIADLIELYLQNENYTVLKYNNATDALQIIEEGEVDLAILDIMLPDTNGLLLCKKIREKYTYPIIILTAKDHESDKITGLTYGADDYITKPFRPLELVARVKAQLRRYMKYNPAKQEQIQAPIGIITHGALEMDTNKFECYLDGEALQLTPTEFSILRILLERKGNVISSEELFHQIWQEEYYSKSNNTISVHVRHLREKMQRISENADYIKTVWGVGYKIENHEV